jgi:hypothetical protein
MGNKLLLNYKRFCRIARAALLVPSTMSRIFLAECALRHADIVRLAVREVMNSPTTLANATEQSRDFMHLLVDVVRRGQATGELRPGIEPRLAAGIITAAYFAIITEWVRCGGQCDLQGAVQQALNVVLNGLAEEKTKEVSAISS